MSRYLLIDVGAGTLDLLCHDESTGEHFKAVLKSPLRTIANAIRNLNGDLLVTGVEMGGGRIASLLKERAQSHRVVMSTESAATIHHDPERVKSFGIEIVGPEEARSLADRPEFAHIALADIEPARIQMLVEGLGIPFKFDTIGLCAQDHGVAPRGVSHLDFRHQLFANALDRLPFPHALVFPADSIPETFNRLRCMARTASTLPADEIYVMDSGMAAIQGACCDPLCRDMQQFMVLDIATSHTVGAAIAGGEIAGFFEYHTRDITVEKLDRLLRQLPGGEISHARILGEGGHGAYTRRRFDYSENEIIITTGPQRAMMADSSLPLSNGAPWGDNMMTGTVGILEAIRKLKQS